MNALNVAHDNGSQDPEGGLADFIALEAPLDRASLDWIASTIRSLAPELAEGARQADRAYRIPGENMELIRRAGLLKVLVSPERGGLGGDVFHGRNVLPFVVAMEELARVDMSTAHCFQVHNHTSNFLETVCRPDQSDRYLGSGAGLLCWVGSEPGHTARPDQYETVATPVEGGYVVSGVKSYATNATAADWLLTHTRRADADGAGDGASMQMMMIRTDADGVEIDDTWWRPSGMRACVSPKVILRDVFVPEEDLVADPGYYGRSGLGARVHMGFAANYLGASQGILDFLSSYLAERGTRKDPHTQRAVGQIRVAITSARLMVYNAALAWAIRDVREAEQTSLAAKFQALAVAEVVADKAVRAAGSSALFETHPLERILRDLRVHALHAHMDSTAQMIGMDLLGFAVDAANQQLLIPSTTA